MWYEFINCYNEKCRVRLIQRDKRFLKIFKLKRIFILVDIYYDYEWENSIEKDITNYGKNDMYIKDLVKTLNEEDYKNELIDIAKRLFSNDKILYDRLS